MNNRHTDHSGERHGKLRLLRAVRNRYGNWSYDCLCDCGAMTNASWPNINRGTTKSCGCLRRLNRASQTHGLSRTYEHRVWKGLRTRCYNKRNRAYKFYGAKGVTICEQWADFSAFLKDMGRAPSEDHSIDRIDPAGNYEPSNCRWADWRTQCENKRDTVRLTHNGESLTVRAWAERIGVSAAAIRARLKYMLLERALTEPKIAPRITESARRACPNHKHKYPKQDQ